MFVAKQFAGPTEGEGDFIEDEQRAVLSEKNDPRVERLLSDAAGRKEEAEALSVFFTEKLNKSIRTAIVVKRLLQRANKPELTALRDAMVVPGDLLPCGTSHVKLHHNRRHTKKVNGPIFGVSLNGSDEPGAPAAMAVSTKKD